jgi:hypothetical protein
MKCFEFALKWVGITAVSQLLYLLRYVKWLEKGMFGCLFARTKAPHYV